MSAAHLAADSINGDRLTFINSRRSRIKVLAFVLRHRGLDTAVIYTKVEELPNLARVALPWPEQQPLTGG